MNIDERLERLADRHEALAQSVEMLNASIREQGVNIERIINLVDKDADNIRALARIAEIREHRISHLEGDTPN